MGRDQYEKAGVSIQKGDKLAHWLKESHDKDAGHDSFELPGQVLAGIGGFAGQFLCDFSQYAEPVLVACNDGVGTKLLLAQAHHQLLGSGIDLVAMCVNDLYCCGARPLFFLDYYACGHLSEQAFKEVLQGIKLGLRQAKCLLLGGETAELPGLYQNEDFDLAGFVVGVVDKSRRLLPEHVEQGDVVLGLESSGFHSNGYSLIRKWLVENPTLKEQWPSLVDYLLTPTRIYSCLPELLQKFEHTVHAAAHITGGGLSGNIARVIPESLMAELHCKAWKIPDPMRQFIELCSQKDPFEFEDVFNLGVGLVLIVSKNKATEIQEYLVNHGFPCKMIGSISARRSTDPVVFIKGDK